MNDVGDVFLQPLNREIRAVVCNDFGLVLATHFNAADVALDLRIRLDQVLYLHLVLHPESCNQHEILVFLAVIHYARGEIIRVAEFDQLLVVCVRVVNGAKIDALRVQRELANDRLLHGALLLFLRGLDHGVLFLDHGVFFLDDGVFLFQLLFQFIGLFFHNLVQNFLHLHVILMDF